MKRASFSLILGITVGVVGYMLYQRLREVEVESDPEALADKLAEKLKELEARTATVTKSS